MRILIVTEALVAGGAETFALRLTGKLRQLGHECDLLCLNRDLVDGRLVVRSGVEPILVPLPAIRWVKRLDRLLGVYLQRWLTARLIGPMLERYDIIHSNLLGADLLLAGCKRRRPELRIVSTLHGDYALREHGRTSRNERSDARNWPAERALLQRTIDRWVTISAEQQRAMAGMGIEPGRLVRIANGYEPSPAALAVRKRRPSGEPFTIVMAARGNIPEKGWEPLIAAFQLLAGDVRLILIGAGAHLERLQQQHGADKRIVFAGFQADPAVTIAGADLFALPSTYPAESLPTVIIEALAVGVPVVATDVGEIGAMLIGGGTMAGRLLPLRDGGLDVEDLRQAIQGFIDDRAALALAATATTDAFHPYDLTACAQAYLRLYSEVTAAPDTNG